MTSEAKIICGFRLEYNLFKISEVEILIFKKPR